MTTRSGKGTLERALRRWRPPYSIRGWPLHRVRGWSPPRFGADAELAPDSAFDVQMRERGSRAGGRAEGGEGPGE